MKTKILSKEMVDDTIFTEVEFDDGNGNVFVEKVSHFRPQSVEEINQSIASRAASETEKKKAVSITKTVFDNIETEK